MEGVDYCGEPVFCWLDGLTDEQLLARAGEAEARIDEETAVMRECYRRLLKKGDHS